MRGGPLRYVAGASCRRSRRSCSAGRVREPCGFLLCSGRPSGRLFRLASFSRVLQMQRSTVFWPVPMQYDSLMKPRPLMPRVIGRRSVLVPTALVIGCVSLFSGWVLLERIYWDYWFMPKEKAIDGYDVFPELRYVFFDSTLLVWCLVGLITSVLLLRGALSPSGPSREAKQTLTIYFALLGLLIAGGTVMLIVRSHGY